MLKHNIGLLTFPFGKAGLAPMSNIIKILSPISNELFIITGREGLASFKPSSKIHSFEVKHRSGKSDLGRIINYFLTELSMAYKILKIFNKVQIWIFFWGETLILPIFVAKLLRRKVILAIAGSPSKTYKSMNDPFYKPVWALEEICKYISDNIILYSKSLTNELKMEKYENKIYIAHKHFIDFDSFRVTKKFTDRASIIGYVGRFSEEKGVLNLIYAIDEIVKSNSDIRIILIGDGPLKSVINSFLIKGNLTTKVKVTGWIPHNDLGVLLNEMKLLILPSYTEGLPNILLESMACGTPVLVSNVGAIPDLIKDKFNGFILKSNSPSGIAESAIQALNYSAMEEQIIKNGLQLVRDEFTYASVALRYQDVLNDLIAES